MAPAEGPGMGPAAAGLKPPKCQAGLGKPRGTRGCAPWGGVHAAAITERATHLWSVLTRDKAQ